MEKDRRKEEEIMGSGYEEFKQVSVNDDAELPGLGH